MKPFRARLIAAAVDALRDGRDVIVRAHSSRETAQLRNAILREAGANAIECWNMEGADEDAPIVRALPFGCVPAGVDRLMLPPVVLYDLTTCFERGNVREPAIRSVFA